MPKPPAVPLTTRLTPTSNSNEPARTPREEESQESMYTYIKAVNYLLSSYATNDIIVKAAFQIELYKKFFCHTAVHYAETLKDKFLRFGDAFSK